MKPGAGADAVLSAVKDVMMRRVIVPALLRARPGVAYGLAERLGSLRWRLAGERRRRTERRLPDLLAPHVLPNTDEVIRGLFVARMKFRLREMPLAGMSDDEFSSAVTVDGREILGGAMSKGKGVILLGAHFGPGRLICYVLRRLGYPLVRTRNRVSGDPLLRTIDAVAYGRLEQRMGVRFEDIFLPEHLTTLGHAATGRRMHAALREKRVLCIAPDGRSIANTVLVPVFGRPVGFSPGWQALAEMTGAAVIPNFAVSRCRSPSIVVRLEPEIPRERIESADPLSAVAAFAERLEAHIRRYPCNAVFLFLGPDKQAPVDSSWGRAFWPANVDTCSRRAAAGFDSAHHGC